MQRCSPWSSLRAIATPLPAETTLSRAHIGRMLDEAELRRLLADQPHGEYLLEQRTDGWRVLWRLSEGAPEDEALTPAGDWTIEASAAA